MRAKLPILIGFGLVAMMSANSVQPAHAQLGRSFEHLEDQPGYVPNAAEERLDIALQRQAVYFRTTEPPGTIVVHPDWTPPPEMIQRQPYLPRFMAGGPGNPMGARALYIGNTVYRVHGTNQPQTIGSAVSSGCFRLVNGDIIDLYGRVPVGTKVVVRHAPTL